MAFRRPLIACLVTLTFPALALAQEPPPPTHEQTFEASYVGVTGNASSSTFGLGADVISRPGTWVIRNKASFVRNEANDVLQANAFDFTSRAEKALDARASAFGEYGFFRDRFAGIVHRNSATGGLVLKVLADARQTLALDVGAGYVRERRLAGDDVSSASYLGGTTYKFVVSEAATLSDEFRLTGLVAESSNWRLQHTIALTTRVAAGLSLKVSHAVRYAHLPPPGFKRTDQTMAVALVARFARP
jgi:putative salt-induced outer membrane protein